MMLKRLIRAMIPAPLRTAIVVGRARRHSHKLNEQWGLRRLGERLIDELGPVVLAGPFKGIVLPREATAEHIGPYLLGTYERELHDYWSGLAPGSIPLIVNIGAKVGYYAAGLSRRLNAPAIAFEADRWARDVLRRTIALNRVNVELRGRCDRGDLENLPSGTLVVIDCDGCEEVLLADPLPGGLARSVLVVELHGAMVDDDETAARLRRTHDVRAVPSTEAPSPPPVLDFLDEHSRQMAVEEIRTPQRWLLCTPRS